MPSAIRLTYTVEGVLGSTASAWIRKLCGRPVVLRVHVAPPSALRCTPSFAPVSVPTYTTFGWVGSTAMA